MSHLRCVVLYLWGSFSLCILFSSSKNKKKVNGHLKSKANTNSSKNEWEKPKMASSQGTMDASNSMAWKQLNHLFYNAVAQFFN